MLHKGRYLQRCPDPDGLVQLVIFGEPCQPDPNAERFKLYDPGGSPVYYILNEDLRRFKLWRVIKKDNELAFRKKIDRYMISRRKILSLRKNNPIKRTYKNLRNQKLV